MKKTIEIINTSKQILYTIFTYEITTSGGVSFRLITIILLDDIGIFLIFQIKKTDGKNAHYRTGHEPVAHS